MSSRTIAIILTLLALSCGGALADRLYIDVSAPGIKAIPTAVPAMRIVGKLEGEENAQAIIEEIRRNVAMAGEFELLEPRTYTEDPQANALTPDDHSYDNWRSLGAQLVIKGEIAQGDPGEYRVELHAYDVARRVFLFGKRYKAPASAVEHTSYLFTNTLLEELTGKPGAFGTKIAFVTRKGQTKNIASVRMNGSEFRMLTQNGSLNLNPTWSRDGSSIYLTSYYGGRPNLCRLDLLSGELRYVYRGQGVDMPGEESPDGRTLAFASSEEGNTNIFSMDLQSKKSVRLTSNSAIDVSPSWSPDGRRMVYVSDMRGNPNLFILDTGSPTAAPLRITFEGKHIGDPAWSPNGDKIAYSAMDENGVFQIYTVDAEGKSTERLTSGSKDTSQPSWSPDGRFMAVTSNRDGADAIYVLRLGTGRTWRVSPPGVEASQPAWAYGRAQK